MGESLVQIKIFLALGLCLYAISSEYQNEVSCTKVRHSNKTSSQLAKTRVGKPMAWCQSPDGKVYDCTMEQQTKSKRRRVGYKPKKNSSSIVDASKKCYLQSGKWRCTRYPPDDIDKPSDPSVPLDAVQEECLKAHNEYRRKHHAPDLVIDNEVVQWHKQRAVDIQTKFDHVAGAPYGENLAWHSSKGIPCAKMVKMWYDEVKMYNFNSGGFSMETGHFTQLVWVGTTHLGCGYLSSDKGTHLSCGYKPWGNVQGGYKENVLPP